MPNIPFSGPYVAYTQSGLTQTTVRTASMQILSTVELTPSPSNYSKVFTLTCTVNSSVPNTLLIDSYNTYGIPITQVSPTVYTMSSQYTLANGVTVNNWAYFRLLLRLLRITTSGSTWPNPAFTVDMSLTDGTTISTGTISVSQLNATTPIPAILSGSRTSANAGTLNWTASTQSVGSGVVGYYIFKDGSTTPLANVIGGVLTYTDSTLGHGAGFYTVQAHDWNTPANVSVLSNVVSIPAVFVTTPGVPTITRDWNTNITINWAGSTQTFGPGVGGYYIYKNGNGTVYATVYGAGTLSYVDTATSNTTDYTYQIQAFDLSVVPLVSGITAATLSRGATIPTTPVVSVGGHNTTTATINWTWSTQSTGPGIGGYYIYKDGSSTPYATVYGLSSTDTVAIGDNRSYEVASFDLCSPPNISIKSTPARLGYYILATRFGAASTAYKTDDLSTWTTAASMSASAATPWQCLTTGDQIIFYAPYYSNTITVCNLSTGSTSTAVLTGAGAGDNGLAHQTLQIIRENNLYVACLVTQGTSGNAYSTYSTSVDGITWTSRVLPASGYWNLSACNNMFFLDQFTGSANSAYYSSTDGINWTSRTTTPANFASQMSSFSGDGTGFITTSSSGAAYYSTTGINSWTAITFPLASTYSPRFVGSMWFAGVQSTTNTLATSSDGITWSSATVGWSTPVSSFPIRYSNGKYWSNSNGQAAYSTNGITWTVDNMTGDIPTILNSPVPYWLNKHHFIDSMYFYTSSDGIAWTRNAHGLSSVQGLGYF